MGLTEQRRRLDALHRAERLRQLADATDLRIRVGERGEELHAQTCIFADPCTRSYDLYPESESDPWPSSLYAGTELGALYEGVTPRSVLEAGWRIAP